MVAGVGVFGFASTLPATGSFWRDTTVLTSPGWRSGSQASPSTGTSTWVPFGVKRNLKRHHGCPALRVLAVAFDLLPGAGQPVPFGVARRLSSFLFRQGGCPWRCQVGTVYFFVVDVEGVSLSELVVPNSLFGLDGLIPIALKLMDGFCSFGAR